MDQEYFIEISGVPDYKISNHGRIISFKRVDTTFHVTGYGPSRKRAPRILSLRPDANGDLRCSLQVERRSVTMIVKSLMVKSFFPDLYYEGLVILPIDGNRKNLRLDNLMITGPSEHQAYRRSDEFVAA
jgi:DNA-binding transcriptional ArsR family regulator